MESAAVDLHNLPGGKVELYWNLFQDYARDKTEVRVLGKCMSACTLVVGAIDKSRLCFGPQSMLGFHHAISSMNGKIYTIDTVGTRWMIARYPDDIRAWINRKGGWISMTTGFWILGASRPTLLGGRRRQDGRLGRAPSAGPGRATRWINLVRISLLSRASLRHSSAFF
jgi:hypothetical protein